MGFYNRERVEIDSGTANNNASWGNLAGSLRYVGFAKGTNILATLAGGHFETELPLGGLRPLLTIGTSDRERAALDMDRDIGPVHVYFGGSHDELTFGYRAVSNLAGSDSTLLRSTGTGSVSGAYLEGSGIIAKRLRLRGGLRADRFSLSPDVRIAPRISATILLTDRAAFTLAAGQYRQYVRAPHTSSVFLGSPIPDSTAGPALEVAKASHFTMSLTQDITDATRLGLEGYYKEFSDIPTDDGDRADASGVDLWVRKTAGALRGWIGYSLSWVWQVDLPHTTTRRDFAGRQLVNVGIAGPVTHASEFDVRVSYGAGLPFTAVPEPEAGPPVFDVIANSTTSADMSSIADVSSGPSDAFLRVDAQISRTWKRTVHGSTYTFMPYLRVLNALNRRDALFYRFDKTANSAQPLGNLPILPVFGLEWRF
jgi:hypothetical protein